MDLASIAQLNWLEFAFASLVHKRHINLTQRQHSLHDMLFLGSDLETSATDFSKYQTFRPCREFLVWCHHWRKEIGSLRHTLSVFLSYSSFQAVLTTWSQYSQFSDSFAKLSKNWLMLLQALHWMLECHLWHRLNERFRPCASLYFWVRRSLFQTHRPVWVLFYEVVVFQSVPGSHCSSTRHLWSLARLCEWI